MAKRLRILGRIIVVIAAILLLSALAVQIYDWHLNVHRVDGAVVERAIRAALPAGTPSSVADQYLSQHQIAHSFDIDSLVMYAAVKNIKGSNLLVQSDLGLWLHFDVDRKLVSIDTMRVYTGP